MTAARTSRSANPSPTVDKTHRMRGSGGSGDQIALKDGKHLLVVQYIWHGPFRASAMRRTKMAAVPAASDGSFLPLRRWRAGARRAPLHPSLSAIDSRQRDSGGSAGEPGKTAASTVPPRDR